MFKVKNNKYEYKRAMFLMTRVFSKFSEILKRKF